MTRYGFVLAAVCALAPALVAAQEKAAPTPERLQGAWKLQSLTYDGEPQVATGYILFVGDRYSFVTTRKRPVPPGDMPDRPVSEMSDAEKTFYVEAYRSMTAAAGTFRIENGEIQLMREAVRSPQSTNTYEKRRSWFEGDRLVQDFTGGGRRQVYVWERVAGGTPRP